MEEDPAAIMKIERKTQRGKKKVKATMNFVLNDPEKLAPIVGYFPSGFDPHKKEESEEGERQAVDVRVFRNKQKQGRYKVVVSPENCNVDFFGTNYLGEAACPQVCTYALGVLDKDSGTLNIVPIASNKIFRLEPKLKASNIPKEQDNKPVIEQSSEKKATQIDNATRLYGTKRSIKMAKRRRAIYGGEEDGGGGGDRKIEEGAIDKTAIESMDLIDTQRNTPPLDMAATTPDLVYPLKSIILKGEWPFLSAILDNFCNEQEELPSDDCPSFVRNRVHKLTDIVEKEEREKTAGILSYITYLIVFKEEYDQAKKGSRAAKIPPILRKRFTMMFVEDSRSRKLSKEKIDLLISYVLVLTLFVDSFETDISDIGKDLRMSAVDLRLHYRNLGCKFVRVNTTFRATLCPPIKFSNLSAKGRWRR